MRIRAVLAIPILLLPIVAAHPVHANPTPLAPLTARVTPSPLPADAQATLSVTTLPGAECAAGIVYGLGKRPASWPHILVKTADLFGYVHWTWHHQSQQIPGTIGILCLEAGQARSLSLTIAASARTQVPVQSTPTRAIPTNTPVPPPPATQTPIPSATYTPIPPATSTPGAPPSATRAPQQQQGTSRDAPGVFVQASNLHADTDGLLPPQLGDRYAVVRISIANHGSTPYQYNALDFALQDVSDGIHHQGNGVDTNINSTHLGFGTLAPGQSVTGDVAFEVPVTETHFHLLWTPMPFAPPVSLPISQGG